MGGVVNVLIQDTRQENYEPKWAMQDRMTLDTSVAGIRNSTRGSMQVIGSLIK